MIRTLVADDEPLAREGIRTRLELERDIEVVGEAEDGQQAATLILTLRPDLVFLDVQMPGLDGFEVLRKVPGTHLPVVVFVTAYDQYALRAFEAHALDYLLKPFNGERFREALRRARREVQRADALDRQERIRRLVDDEPRRSEGTPAALTTVPGTGHADEYLARLPVRDGERYLLLDVTEIDYLESAGNYVLVHVGNDRFQMRSTLRSMEEQLDPHSFVRIHRSVIVNVERVVEVLPEWHGDFDVKLRDGTVLRMSRTHKKNLIP